jgi:hypothetical protein
MNDKLIELINRFQSLAEKTGRSKSTSYQVILHFTADDEVEVNLGGYDIGNWNRHTTFSTNKRDLIRDLELKVTDAERVVNNER